MKHFILILLFASHILAYSSNNSLWVQDPKYRWLNSESGIIEEAEIAIRPLGSFIEYSLYLTISASAPNSFDEQTQLEISMDFELPENSLLTDWWLWINDEPKQAEIVDISSVKTDEYSLTESGYSGAIINESGFSNPINSFLLTRDKLGEYSIDIFPILPNESRKFKITYLSPASYFSGDVSVDLPVHILNLSSIPLSEITAYFLPSNYYSNPKSGNPDISFTSYMHAEYGTCKRSIINYENLYDHQLTLENETENTESEKGFEFSYYGDSSEGYYQLSLTPSVWLENVDSVKKMCFLIDYDNDHFLGESDDMLQIVKEKIVSFANEKDSFNIIFSDLSMTQAFPEWMPATTENIGRAFENARVTNDSNYPPLLEHGINFINDHGGTGSLVLISNSGDQESNNSINDMNRLNTNEVPICVIDYANNNLSSQWINGNQYKGNSYFFTNLVESNNGQYLAYFEQNNTMSLNAFLNYAFDDILDNVIDRPSFYTNYDDGYYDRWYDISSTFGQKKKHNMKFYCFGRYQGSLPSSVAVSLESVSELIELDEADFVQGDSTIKTIWEGLDIISYETHNVDSQKLNELINRSIENNVLSYFTAFLWDEDSDDESSVHVQNNIHQPISLFPNPFTSTLKIELPENGDFQYLKIINISGQSVKEFNTGTNENIYVWNGLAENGLEVESGIYIIIAAYKGRIISNKVIKR